LLGGLGMVEAEWPDNRVKGTGRTLGWRFEAPGG
jgi:hypothetical protein